MEKFYVFIFVIACLEIIRYKKTDSAMFKNEKLVFIFLHLMIMFIAFTCTITESLPAIIHKEMYPAIITACIFAFILDVSLLLNLVREIKD
ncbi:MAG TPA: hypothetical protein DDY21_01440 [Candidatus Moranbacteria bacterium]|nr:hypothetical protein [Candidatus Moranbacteria bacterium]HCO99470.1 hypothetical protein [Candidatus Moranbacteria bacterium]